MDQYIKVQIQKRGICLIQNTYSGFDTEYESISESSNENLLLSVQTAVQRRTILKIPSSEPFDISYVNPLTSAISDTFASKVDGHNNFKYSFINKEKEELEEIMEQATIMGEEGAMWQANIAGSFGLNESESKERIKFKELLILNNSIKLGIKQIRAYLFPTIDSFCVDLISQLKCLKGLRGFEEFEYYHDSKRNQIIFFFPLTLPEVKIAFPEGPFSLKDLLEMCKSNTNKTIFHHDLESFPTSSSTPLPTNQLSVTSPIASPIVQKVNSNVSVSTTNVDKHKSSESSTKTYTQYTVNGNGDVPIASSESIVSKIGECPCVNSFDFFTKIFTFYSQQASSLHVRTKITTFGFLKLKFSGF